MKDVLAGLLTRPAYLVLISGIGLLVLAAAGALTIQGQTIAVADTVWRIVIAVIGLLLAAASLLLIFRDRTRRPQSPLKFKYDVFLASPMAALVNGPAFTAQRDEVVTIKEALLAHCGVKTIYDAGQTLKAGQWEPNDVAAEVDLEALRHSRYFLLVYPVSLASSVLFEAGYALGMGKPAVYIVRDAKHLPFLMQELNNLSRIYPQVRIWECEDTAAIVERVRRSGTRIFTTEPPLQD